MFITLTELRYVVALAQEKHFGKAANKCFVSQPTLSIAIKKLENTLNTQIFERNKNQVVATLRGLEIIAMAQQVLESVLKIEEFAKSSDDPFATPLKLGAIHTIGPYLFPDLISQIKKNDYPLKLIIEEGMTANLTDKLLNGELDAIIVATPDNNTNIITDTLYAEDLKVIIPASHPWHKKELIDPQEITQQTMLILGQGHCFRDQVLSICPNCILSATENNHSITTTSIETIKYMVANNIGISIVPSRSLRNINNQELLVKPFISPPPMREVVLAYRKNFSRQLVLNELIKLIQKI